jgi:hypothetical protein
MPFVHRKRAETPNVLRFSCRRGVLHEPTGKRTISRAEVGGVIITNWLNATRTAKKAQAVNQEKCLDHAIAAFPGFSLNIVALLFSLSLYGGPLTK